ncbi:MAG: hypothetical protein AB7E76_06755 [Deferribacterales bacterium]
MDKAIISRAKNSIAFNLNKIDSLNKSVAKLDARLYAFAYYEPIAISECGNYRFNFNIAILNLHALLWDCGTMVRDKILNKYYKLRPTSLIKITSPFIDDIDRYYSVIHNIRTHLCHNNSQEYYYNKQCYSMVKNYYLSKCNNATPDIANSSDDWKLLFNDIIDIAEYIETKMSETIRKFTLLPPVDKSEVINFWLNSIKEYYANDSEMILDTLTYKYLISPSFIQTAPVTKNSVKKWVGLKWNSLTNRRIPYRDSYNDYIQVCKTRIGTALNNTNCPRPALPLDIYHAVTSEADHF